ncbi:MAG: hypothetical protein ACQKBU_04140 [Verrucomicrobiales bacterium]
MRLDFCRAQIRRCRQWLKSLSVVVYVGLGEWGFSEDALDEGFALSAALLVEKGLILDLDASKGLELEEDNRVRSWSNQMRGKAAGKFSKQDEGRALAGSGRPTWRRSVASIGGKPAVLFEEQELIHDSEDAFDHLVTGSGYTWFSVMAVHPQRVGKKDVNAFFGNLRNGPPYDGFWGNLMDDNRVWMGTRNGLREKGTEGLWHPRLNPCVSTPEPIEVHRFYVVAGRMGAGGGVVKLELFVNSPDPVDCQTVPVNAEANPSKMAIGQERDAVNHPGKESFHGEIARFLIYERPLSTQELASMFRFLSHEYLIQLGD